MTKTIFWLHKLLAPTPFRHGNNIPIYFNGRELTLRVKNENKIGTYTQISAKHPIAMRKPTTIECLYLDFDGFFASVEQQAKPYLRGKPVGIVPFDGTRHTAVIAVSKEAKARGCTNIMSYEEARRIAPKSFLYLNRRTFIGARIMPLWQINTIIPIDAIKSIDELMPP